MTFRTSNERLKDEFNAILRRGAADVGALHHEHVRDLGVAMLDAMDGEGEYPRTARALGQAGVSPVNMSIISCNPLETLQMRHAIQHTPLHWARVCEVTLGCAEPLPFELQSLHLCILDGCSGRPNTLKMVREMLPYLRPGAVVVVGITRRHNQDPLPTASQRALEACVAEEQEDDPHLESRLKRMASVQLVQHLTEVDMRALGARPFWPMWNTLGALSYDGYGEQNLMVYMPYIVGGGAELLVRAPWPLRVHEGGARLLEGECAKRTLLRIRALTKDENSPRQTRSQTMRRRKRQQEEKGQDEPLAQKRIRKARAFYNGVYCPSRITAPRIPVGRRWKYVPRV